jgi:epoxyqueuosine reductase
LFKIKKTNQGLLKKSNKLFLELIKMLFSLNLLKKLLNKSELTKHIKLKAQELGFMYCGISKAEFLAEQAPKLENWLKNNMHGNMQWMENHFDKRLNPALLHEGTQSVISVLLNYFPSSQQIEDTYKISKYAYGEDYHYVLKDKLNLLLDFIKIQIGEVNGRAFVDSAPIMDKVWAEKSGLGWIGKNANLINKQSGSFFFIGELLLDVELDYDGPIKDYCGTCTACIDACPTNAIVEPYVVDGSKCISYYTIELKEMIPAEATGKMDNWIFGCDVCQDVCPWNRFSIPHTEERFLPNQNLLNMSKTDFEALKEDVFKEITKKSAIKRTKFGGLKRNIDFLKLKKEN